MVIEADQLTVERLGRIVLRDVSLRVEDRQCVSIIGPNGAGKSTLMAAMAGLLTPHSGTVRLNGDPIHKLRRREVARRLAYVPQTHDGYLGFTVRDVVESGRYAYLEPLESLSASDRQAVDESVAACRIGDLLDRRVETLSGGERQKVWIAAALTQQTPILCLDEPTTALDPAHQVDLIRIMRAYVRGGRTLLVIGHDLNLPMALGGRVVALREGTVFFDRRVDVLEETRLLGELFGTPFVLHRDETGTPRSIQFQLEEASE